MKTLFNFLIEAEKKVSGQGTQQAVGAVTETIAAAALIHRHIDKKHFKKPVILTSFDGPKILPWHLSARRLVEYEHMKKLINLGGVTVVQNYDELFQTINKYLLEKKFLYF